MNSKRVALELAFYTIVKNSLCFIVLFDMCGLRLSDLDGGRNNGKPYIYNEKSAIIWIRQITPFGNPKIKLLARTRQPFLCQCGIDVLSQR